MPTIAIWSLAALGLQLLYGAFVAGLDAGHVFNDGFSLNTWPLMGGEVYPPSLAGAVRHAHAISGKPVLVTEHGVAAIPVSAFYAEGAVRNLVRFCFAKRDATLDAALERLAAVVRRAA